MPIYKYPLMINEIDFASHYYINNENANNITFKWKWINDDDYNIQYKYLELLNILINIEEYNSNNDKYMNRDYLEAKIRLSLALISNNLSPLTLSTPVFQISSNTFLDDDSNIEENLSELENLYIIYI